MLLKFLLGLVVNLPLFTLLFARNLPALQRAIFLAHQRQSSVTGISTQVVLGSGSA